LKCIKFPQDAPFKISQSNQQRPFFINKIFRALTVVAPYENNANDSAESSNKKGGVRSLWRETITIKAWKHSRARLDEEEAP
jgi:hypothetical protein